MGYRIPIPRYMIGSARILRMIRTMSRQYMQGETAKSIQVDDLPEYVIEWLEENVSDPEVVDDNSLEFKTKEDAMLFKMRWL